MSGVADWNPLWSLVWSTVVVWVGLHFLTHITGDRMSPVVPSCMFSRFLSADWIMSAEEEKSGSVPSRDPLAEEEIEPSDESNHRQYLHRWGVTTQHADLLLSDTAHSKPFQTRNFHLMSRCVWERYIYVWYNDIRCCKFKSYKSYIYSIPQSSSYIYVYVLKKDELWRILYSQDYTVALVMNEKDFFVGLRQWLMRKGGSAFICSAVSSQVIWWGDR